MGVINRCVNFFIFVLCLVHFVSCQDLRNSDKLLFVDNANSVQRALSRMEFLMGKFPETNMVNYGVDNEGYLYLSNQKIARYDNAIHNNLVRNDIVFDEFTSEEINEFFVLMELLRRNEISSCYKEPLLGRFIFDYRSEGVTSSDKVRHVMIVTSKTDTLDGNFLKYFKVLDSYERLILFKLNRR